MHNDGKKSPPAPVWSTDPGPQDMVGEDQAKLLLQSLMHLLPTIPEEYVRLTKEAVDGEWTVRTGSAAPEDRAAGEYGGPNLEGRPEDRLSDGAILKEVEVLVRSVQKMRQHFMPNGKPRADVSPRDAVSLQTSSMGSLERLVKFRDRLNNQARLNAYQRAIIRALEKADPALSDRVQELLAEELEKVI